MATSEFADAAQVEAAVLVLYHDPSRANEASQFLLRFQQDLHTWEVAEALLRSAHADVTLFGACCLHQKAKSQAAHTEQQFSIGV